MSIRAHVLQTLDELNEADLAQMAEFAEQDRELAEAGMADYTTGLHQEDTLKRGRGGVTDLRQEVKDGDLDD